MKTILAVFLVLSLVACAPSQEPDTDANISGATPADIGSSSAGSTANDSTAASSTTPEESPSVMLTQYHWRLASATDKTGKRIDAFFANMDKPLQLDFDESSLSISNTCNRMQGSYAIADDKLVLGKLASTMMACADSTLTALDTAVGQYLHDNLAFVLDNGPAGRMLTLGTAQGDTLEFIGTPTADTRFGSKGETVFLEIAPQLKPCNDPGRPDALCLEVRVLHYAEDGTRAGNPGPWHTLGQTIEGYTYQRGVRNVLRVKRYEIKNPPADGSSVAYVLDLVVESQTAPKG